MANSTLRQSPRRLGMNHLCHLATTLLLVGLAGPFALATNQVAQTLSSSGSMVTNAAHITETAGPQGRPVGFSANASYLNHAGFIHAYSLTAGVKMDTDGDGLKDWAEIAGSAFSPGTPTPAGAYDADGDGFSDGEESQLGTNPGDDASQLAITDITYEEGDAYRISWLARQGKTYDLFLAGPGNPEVATGNQHLVTATAGPGTGVWQSTVLSTTTNLPPEHAGFVHIRLQ